MAIDAEGDTRYRWSRVVQRVVVSASFVQIETGDGEGGCRRCRQARDKEGAHLLDESRVFVLRRAAR